MLTETKWQTDICKVLNSRMCYAKKWASPQYNIGVPDLIVCAGEVHFIEVKKLNVPDLERFDRKVELTRRQQEEMMRIDAVKPRTTLLVVCEGIRAAKAMTRLVPIRRYNHEPWGREFQVTNHDFHLTWGDFKEADFPLGYLLRSANEYPFSAGRTT